jgi:hypothetical protein
VGGLKEQASALLLFVVMPFLCFFRNYTARPEAKGKISKYDHLEISYPMKRTK